MTLPARFTWSPRGQEVSCEGTGQASGSGHPPTGPLRPITSGEIALCIEAGLPIGPTPPRVAHPIQSPGLNPREGRCHRGNRYVGPNAQNCYESANPMHTSFPQIYPLRLISHLHAVTRMRTNTGSGNRPTSRPFRPLLHPHRTCNEHNPIRHLHRTVQLKRKSAASAQGRPVFAQSDQPREPKCPTFKPLHVYPSNTAWATLFPAWCTQ